MAENSNFIFGDQDKREKSNNKSSFSNSVESVIGNQSALSYALGNNHTGIPDSLKSKVEKKSGMPLDDVKVHYNSNKPAAVQAYAYTQGNQVYVAPGQAHHLSHELGHVVQQKQGRVKPTGYIGGQPLNDSSALEREADSYR